MSQPSDHFKGLVTQEPLEGPPAQRVAAEANWQQHSKSNGSSNKSAPGYTSRLLCCFLNSKHRPEPEEDADDEMHSQNNYDTIAPQSDSPGAQHGAQNGARHGAQQVAEQQPVAIQQPVATVRPTPKSTAARKEAQRFLLPSQENRFFGRKTLVLDLDETLVHSSFSPVQCEMVLKLTLGAEQHKVYVKKRPGVDEFLKVVSKWYEVVIFTASTALYANTLLDELDADKTITYRLFREACTRYREGYVKDLSRLGRDLDHVIIIDNLPICYALQPENAIPIKTWRDDPEDTELFDLVPILVSLARVEHVPRVLQEILYDDGDAEG